MTAEIGRGNIGEPSPFRWGRNPQTRWQVQSNLWVKVIQMAVYSTNGSLKDDITEAFKEKQRAIVHNKRCDRCSGYLSIPKDDFPICMQCGKEFYSIQPKSDAPPRKFKGHTLRYIGTIPEYKNLTMQLIVKHLTEHKRGQLTYVGICPVRHEDRQYNVCGRRMTEYYRFPTEGDTKRLRCERGHRVQVVVERGWRLLGDDAINQSS